MNLFAKCKDDLKKVNYFMVTYTDGKCPLTDSQLKELDKIAIRVIGFDSMFKTKKFTTITYVSSLDGFQRLLDVGIFKRFVSSHELLQNTRDIGGTTHVLRPHLVLQLNEHEFTKRFKSRFIGVGGERIKKLSSFLQCSIELADPIPNQRPCNKEISHKTS